MEHSDPHISCGLFNFEVQLLLEVIKIQYFSTRNSFNVWFIYNVLVYDGYSFIYGYIYSIWSLGFITSKIIQFDLFNWQPKLQINGIYNKMMKQKQWNWNFSIFQTDGWKLCYFWVYMKNNIHNQTVTKSYLQKIYFKFVFIKITTYIFSEHLTNKNFNKWKIEFYMWKKKKHLCRHLGIFLSPWSNSIKNVICHHLLERNWILKHFWYKWSHFQELIWTVHSHILLILLYIDQFLMFWTTCSATCFSDEWKKKRVFNYVSIRKLYSNISNFIRKILVIMSGNLIIQK